MTPTELVLAACAAVGQTYDEFMQAGGAEPSAPRFAAAVAQNLRARIEAREARRDAELLARFRGPSPRQDPETARRYEALVRRQAAMPPGKWRWARAGWRWSAAHGVFYKDKGGGIHVTEFTLGDRYAHADFGADFYGNWRGSTRDGHGRSFGIDPKAALEWVREADQADGHHFKLDD